MSLVWYMTEFHFETLVLHCTLTLVLVLCRWKLKYELISSHLFQTTQEHGDEKNLRITIKFYEKHCLAVVIWNKNNLSKKVVPITKTLEKRFFHSHKKQKDNLEGSLDRVLFAAEPEFPNILVPRHSLKAMTQATSEFIKCKHWNCRKIKTTVFFMWPASWYIFILWFWH